jgi:hypothetical protein
LTFATTRVPDTFVRPAANTPDATAQPAALWPASTDRRGRFTRILGIVRKLIDYGKELAISIRERGLTERPAGASSVFGTLDISLILSRIGLALLRCQALEVRLQRGANRPNPQPRAPRAPSLRVPRAPRQQAAPATEPDPRPARLPSIEQIAAEIHRRPVGAVLADICRDLGIMADHPLWRELDLAILFNGGGVGVFFKDMCRRTRATRHALTNALAAPPAPSPPLSLAPASTGPP